MSITLYQVGGSVRDELMGLKSKDIDYAVEMLDVQSKASPFDTMYEALKGMGVEIFDGAAKPEFLTVRGKWDGHASDFVLCRKEGAYTDGRHPDTVTPGTLYDDLARRDFTCNAIAKAQDGSLIDPHGGEADIAAKRLRCVGSPQDRFTEDGLRMLRALRFSITKYLQLDKSIAGLLNWPEFYGPRLVGVSLERIREELYKCFAFDTVRTFDIMSGYSGFFRYLLASGKLWLKPTLEGR